MAKKTKESQKDLFYNEEQPKKKLLKKGKIQNSKEKDNELFSFDNEIIIGVTKKQEQKKQVKKENNKNKIKNKQHPKQTSKNKTKQKTIKKQVKNKRKITHTIKYIMLIVLFISVVLCAMFSPLFNIKTIEVIGNEKITNNEIINLSQIQLEDNTFKISKTKIINLIKENAYINEVIIKRKLPSNIIITVEERKPAYLLEYASGYIYLDKQGYMLEINSEKLELPILQGALTQTSEFIVGNRLCIEDLEKLAILSKIMQLAEVNEISNLISRIDIENKQNIKLIFETKDKIAHLGDSTNLIDKIPLIKKILEETEGVAGEIFVNMDLNKENPIFRERV